jgi:hypothetical protein
VNKNIRYHNKSSCKNSVQSGGCSFIGWRHDIRRQESVENGNKTSSVIKSLLSLRLLLRNLCSCGSRDQTVHFAYVTSSRVEGKQTHILCKPKTLPTEELRQRDTKYCRWEIMFLVWTVYASLSATPPTPFDPIPFSFYHTWNAQIRFDYCTVPRFTVEYRLQNTSMRRNVDKINFHVFLTWGKA